MGHVPRQVGHGGCPVGSRAFERQYRGWQAVVVARVTREGKNHAGRDQALFAGVDWGSESHQVCRLDAGGAVAGERAFRHDGAGLAALCDRLVSLAGGSRAVAVAIEVPHGPVVDVLLDRGFAVHAISPNQLDRLRDRISVAGAKDDRRDARIAAAGLRTDPHLFRQVTAGDPRVVELREWSRLAEELQQERMRLANRIRQQLWRYYPQLLELGEEVTAEWILALWTMVPTPAKAAQLREATVGRLLARHRIRRLDAAGVLGVLRQPAITVAAGVHRGSHSAPALPGDPAAARQPRFRAGRTQARRTLC